MRELKCTNERGQDDGAGETGELISSAFVSQHRGGEKPRESGETNGQAGGKFVLAETPKGEHLYPISKRGLSKSWVAVRVEDHPMLRRHRCGSRAGVLTVDLVQQTREPARPEIKNRN